MRERTDVPQGALALMALKAPDALAPLPEYSVTRLIGRREVSE